MVRAAVGEDRQVHAQVRDTGKGIAEADMERLFGIFVTTKSDGMGLGQTIYCPTSEAHGGHLRAGQPDEPAELIEFTLPIAAELGV